MKKLNVRINSLIITFLLCCSFNVVAQSTVSNVRIWPAPDNTRIVFDLSGPVDHQIFLLKKPDRLVVDLKDTNIKSDVSQLELKNSPIINVRGASKDKTNYRIVFDLNSVVKPQSFVLPPNAKYGHRLVVDLRKNVKAKVVKTERDLKPKSRSKARSVIVAIDAGHGGEDPGASGRKGTKEKVVVLQIAKELHKRLKRTKGIKPVLIRTGDYYLSLSERPRLAKKKYNADIFISIHADAFTDPRARGASVFALSRKGATSSTARYLAAKENESDLIGGVRIDEKDEMVRNVIVDLIMEGSLQHSLYMGDKMLQKMGGIGKLHKNRVEQAGFRVLKSPDMVSVLVETGFISNPTEEKRLSSRSYQRKLADALTVGLENYLRQYPVPDSYYAMLKETQRNYVVTRGDTLSGIAHRYGTSMKTLRKLNKLKSDSVRIGQRLKIPAK